MKYLSNERGALPIIIAILVVLLVAAGGLAVYNVNKSHQKAASTVGSSSPSPSTSPQASASPAGVATPTPTPSNIFTVKELGIQFTVTSDIRDLVYEIQTSNGVSAAYFSTQSLEAADKNAGGNQCTPAGDAPVGAIDLRSFTPDGDVAIKKIGNQYLNYSHAQAMCSSSSSVMGLANKQAASFQQALQTAEAISQ